MDGADDGLARQYEERLTVSYDRAFVAAARPPAFIRPVARARVHKVGADRRAGVVALRGLEPNTLLGWLREMDLLRHALGVAA
jgi:hypothetical protein